MKKKNNLRIILYGKYALKDVKQLSEDLKKEEKMETNNVEYFYTKDNITSWEYLIFPNEIDKRINETIKNILENDYKSKFNDVLVISIDNLLDEDSKSAFSFFEGFTQILSQQPFLLFLTKKDNNPNVLSLFQFIKNEFFDKRNVFAYKLPTNDEEKKIINNFFIYTMNYYNEIGGNTNEEESQTFNILICGRAGTGKSSFINQFLQEKKAKEGEGTSVTHKINSYVHRKYPIRIFDTPGFEGKETVEMVQRKLDQFEKNISDSKSHYELIIYFCHMERRTFYEFEEELVKSIIQKNKKIIFVLNNFGECKSLTKIYETSLTQYANDIKNYDKSKLKSILDNITTIRLKQGVEEEGEEEEEGKIKIKQGYGMDKLFKKIYDLFQGYKIEIHEIEATENVKEIINIIQKYKLISYIKDIEDITVNLEIELAKQILSYSKYDSFVWFFRDTRRKELLQLINEKSNGPKIEDIDNLFSNIESEIKKLTNDDKQKIKSEFFESIKKYKGIFDTEGFPFDAWFYNEYTFLVGVLYMKKILKKDHGKYDEQCKKFLKKLSTSLNTSIDAFGELADEWKEIYASLKAHKSDKEWVNKFFIVEIPKPAE